MSDIIAVLEEPEQAVPSAVRAVLVYCLACGGDTHIEHIGVQDYYVCDDVTCMWMQPV